MVRKSTTQRHPLSSTNTNVVVVPNDSQPRKAAIVSPLVLTPGLADAPRSFLWNCSIVRRCSVIQAPWLDKSGPRPRLDLLKASKNSSGVASARKPFEAVPQTPVRRASTRPVLPRSPRIKVSLFISIYFVSITWSVDNLGFPDL